MKHAIFALLTLTMLLMSACQPVSDMDFETLDLHQALQSAQAQDKVIFLFVYQDPTNPYVKAFTRDIFNDEAVATYFNRHFVNVSLQVDAPLRAGSEGVKPLAAKGWPDLWQRYGVYQYPTLLLLTPQGDVITDIVDLGNLGRDEKGELTCRTQLLRIASLAHRFQHQNDSVFFDEKGWAQLNQVPMRLDSKLFERVASRRDFLRSRYGHDWDVMIDYTMASASVRLMIHEKNRPSRCNDFRVKAYYQALEKYNFPLNERYRLYADVNIAYGKNDLLKARELAYHAYKHGIIQEMEYFRLSEQLK